jgi:hypothetical protein
MSRTNQERVGISIASPGRAVSSPHVWPLREFHAPGCRRSSHEGAEANPEHRPELERRAIPGGHGRPPTP